MCPQGSSTFLTGKRHGGQAAEQRLAQGCPHERTRRQASSHRVAMWSGSSAWHELGQVWPQSRRASQARR